MIRWNRSRSNDGAGASKNFCCCRQKAVASRKSPPPRYLASEKSQWYLLLAFFDPSDRRTETPLTNYRSTWKTLTDGRREGRTVARQATMADTTLAGRFHRLNCLQSVKLSTCKSMRRHNIVVEINWWIAFWFVVLRSAQSTLLSHPIFLFRKTESKQHLLKKHETFGCLPSSQARWK
jgi:hypothetical protein